MRQILDEIRDYIFPNWVAGTESHLDQARKPDET